MFSIPRPFYVIGHNPNSIEKVREALDAGANAIEPDINIYRHNPDQLCISHFEGGEDAPSLETFLLELRLLAMSDQRLSLVIFDCKENVANPESGIFIMNSIRRLLSFDTNLNIIMSVSGLSSASIFDGIRDSLRPREALMIDETNDPQLVSGYFKNTGVVNNCFGNGTSIPGMPVTGPNVRPSMEKAVALRAATGSPKFICVWTVNDESQKQEFLHIGVDGIISDDLQELRRCVEELEDQKLVRLAVRDDNPFIPLNNAYCLSVYTTDQHMAGTDAHITFTLTGKDGTASYTIDASLQFRMERGEMNVVTMQSHDLGELISVTVQRDNSGNAPGWFLNKIIAESVRYSRPRTALFNQEIADASPVTKIFLPEG